MFRSLVSQRTGARVLVGAGVVAGLLALVPAQRGAVAAPASFTAYGDARAAGWVDWSWDSSVNYGVAAPVYSGTRAISWTVKAAWGGLYLHSDTAIGSSPYASLDFALQPTRAGQNAPVVLQDVSDHPLGPVVMLTSFGGTPAPGVWTHYSIPLSALGGVNKAVGGIIIQEESGKAEPPMHVDQIALIAATAGTTPPPPILTINPLATTPSPTPTVKPLPTSSPKPTTTPPPAPPPATRTPPTTATRLLSAMPSPVATVVPPAAGAYPLHTSIVSTTFWVGELFNASLSDGSQACSTYDSQWDLHFSGVATNMLPAAAAGCAGSYAGGCDGVWLSGACNTEPRRLANNFFPTAMTPAENPFYLDLPFDDLNDATAFNERCQVIPWASQPGFTGHCTDSAFSYMKNHWVRITGPNGHTCFGQVEDAGPSHGTLYHDAAYVFGSTDARPVQGQFNDAGLDVSPSLNGCLGFAELNGDNDYVTWQFVDAKDVPAGPWKLVVTASPPMP